MALTNATLPYILQLANLGFALACDRSDAIRLGVNTYEGHATCQGVAQSLGLPYKNLRNRSSESRSSQSTTTESFLADWFRMKLSYAHSLTIRETESPGSDSAGRRSPGFPR